MFIYIYIYIYIRGFMKYKSFYWEETSKFEDYSQKIRSGNKTYSRKKQKTNCAKLLNVKFGLN